VYTSTIGMEFVERSRSVIVVGHVHYAGRGFTIDPESSSAYLDAIDRSMRESVRLSDEERKRLVDYVAWFFFVRLCPFEPLTGIAEDWPRVTVKNLRDLSAPTMQGFNQLVRLIADGVPWW